MTEPLRRNLPIVVTIALAAISALYAFGNLVGQTGMRIGNVEVRVQRIEDRQEKLEKQLIDRLESIDGRLTTLSAEQRILHGQPPNNPVKPKQ